MLEQARAAGQRLPTLEVHEDVSRRLRAPRRGRPGQQPRDRGDPAPHHAGLPGPQPLIRVRATRLAWLPYVVAKHPELFADLPPLPKTLAECKGGLSASPEG